MCLSGIEKIIADHVELRLEKKCEDKLIYTEIEPLLTKAAKDFIDEFSRRYLTVLCLCIYEQFKIELCFVKKTKQEHVVERLINTVYNGHVLFD